MSEPSGTTGGTSAPAAAIRSLRWRAGAELSLIVVLTPIYLLVVPGDMAVYAVTALAFLAYVLIDAWSMRELIWPAPSTALPLRRARAWRLVAGVTAAFAALFLVIGLARGATLVAPTLIPALILYLAWAAVQQTIFQVYLLGRLRILLPGRDPRVYAVVNGLAYGAVHVPWGVLTVATAAAGILWSFSYQRDRLLLPIVVSHAVLAVSYYGWVQDRDFIAEIVARIG